MEIHDALDTHEDIFEIKTANECLAEAPSEAPQMLIGDLWMTGELSVMFAEAGTGKSLLAVQIAESIARGESVKPFEMTAPAQKVLYIDLEQSPRQFRRRYTAEPDGHDERASSVQDMHEFSDNFLRPTVSDAIEIRASMLAPVIEKTGAKVLIIDNIAYLQRYAIPRETAAVMRELRTLRNRFGLSILVLTHTARSIGRRRGLTASDMACAGVMTNYADNVFAIGRGNYHSNERYIKHIKPGAEPLSYGAEHLPWFAIVRSGGPFPAFEHRGFASEAGMASGNAEDCEWTLIKRIKALKKAGKTIREIANELNMPRSTVHRYLQMAPPDEPPPKPKEPVFYDFERCIYHRCKGCIHCRGRAANNRKSAPGLIKGHDNCPDNCSICGPRAYRDDDTTVNPNLKRLSDRHYEAMRQWLIEGKRRPRPVYPGERTYGVQRGCWIPGSETWTEEQFQELLRKLMKGYT